MAVAAAPAAVRAAAVAASSRPAPLRRAARRRGLAPPSAVRPGSASPGAGQLVVELAVANEVDQLRDLLAEAYGESTAADLDSSSRAIRVAQLRTAAQRAAHAGSAPALRLLLEHGAELGAAFGNGRAIACEAAARGHAEVLRVLLDPDLGGVQTTVQNGYGRTCLMEAAKNGHVGCVREALDAGAEIDFATKNANATAAMFAAAEGHADCFNLLRESGANLDVKRTMDGKTAMQIHRETVAAEIQRAIGRAKSDA